MVEYPISIYSRVGSVLTVSFFYLFFDISIWKHVDHVLQLYGVRTVTYLAGRLCWKIYKMLERER